MMPCTAARSARWRSPISRMPPDRRAQPFPRSQAGRHAARNQPADDHCDREWRARSGDDAGAGAAGLVAARRWAPCRSAKRAGQGGCCRAGPCAAANKACRAASRPIQWLMAHPAGIVPIIGSQQAARIAEGAAARRTSNGAGRTGTPCWSPQEEHRCHDPSPIPADARSPGFPRCAMMTMNFSACPIRS